MKDKKIVGIVVAVVAVLAVGAVAFVALKNDDNSGSSETESGGTEETVQANCSVVECMEKIEVQKATTMAEIDEIVGFGSETDAMIGSDPIWRFDKKNWISRKEASDGKVTIQATIDKENLKDDNIKLPSSSDLQKDLDNGSFTYEELVEKVGGKGTLTTISSGSRSYTWVDKNGQKLGATFNNESGKCTVASYR